MEYPNFSVNLCVYFTQKKHFEFDSEIYEDYAMFCVHSGSFSYKIDNDDEHILSDGDVVICPPGKRFYRKMLKPTDFCMVKFNTDSAVNFCGQKIYIKDYRRFFTNLEQLRYCGFCVDFTHKHSESHYSRDIVYQIFKQFGEIKTPLSDITEYIDSNFNKNITVTELAKMAGYSVVGFINLFEKFYECSPKEYILNQRMRHARELIKSTDMTVKEIAAYCGIKDEFYFSRFFKKYSGVSPSDFRKMMKL